MSAVNAPATPAPVTFGVAAVKFVHENTCPEALNGPFVVIAVLMSVICPVAVPVTAGSGCGSPRVDAGSSFVQNAPSGPYTL